MQEEDKEEEAPKKEAPKNEEKQEAVKSTSNNSGPAELFVGNLSWNTDDNILYDAFSQYGTVTKARVLVKDGRSQGIGFVEFASKDEAQSALDNCNEMELDGRNIRLRFSENRTQPRQINPDAEGSTTIFIGNVGFNSTKDTLWEFFQQYGTIIDLRLATDQEGNPRGFGHCQFTSAEEAKAALEAHGQYVDGRALRIDLSAPKSASRDGGFGGRGGDRGSRGGSRGGFRGGNDRGRGGMRGSGGRGGFNPSKGSIAEYSGQKIKF